MRQKHFMTNTDPHLYDGSSLMSHITLPPALAVMPSIIGGGGGGGGIGGGGIGSISSTSFPPVVTFPLPSSPPNPPAIPTISEFSPLVRQHRRLVDSDIDHLNSGSSELIVTMKRNRLLVTVPESARGQHISYWMEQYGVWLDENISGFYTIEGSAALNSFVLSFEIEADMMQFALAFK